MNWKKLGKIFTFNLINKDLLTHASNPVAINIQDDVFRIFFSGRNKDNKSSVGFVDVDILKQNVKQITNNTIFKYGEVNSFYSHGVSIGNIYTVDEKKYMLFMGWQVQDSQHWRGDIGRLELEDDKSLVLNPNKVFIGCDDNDKVSLSYPWVMHDEQVYKMWYGSTENWSSDNGEMVHVIKYTTSQDGEVWEKHGLAIPFKIGDAQAFSRPTVFKDDDGYHMWFSYRSGDGTKYRIGYAYSPDGLNWDRKKDSGIDVSPDGWDSEMICYPFVFYHKGKKYMLYNGNDYGKTGFGLAVLEDD